MPNFWIWQDSQYASVPQRSEYARIYLSRVLNISWVLNMPEFWIWQGFEYVSYNTYCEFTLQVHEYVLSNTYCEFTLQVHEYVLRDGRIWKLAKDPRKSTLNKYLLFLTIFVTLHLKSLRGFWICVGFWIYQGSEFPGLHRVYLFS